MPSRSSPVYDLDSLSNQDVESGYVSGSGSELGTTPNVLFTKKHLNFLNRQLQNLDPQGRKAPEFLFESMKLTSVVEILQWCIITFPSLFQTTAFGLSGLATLDMLSKMKIPRPQMVDLIFFDTLHHFPETLTLVDRVRQRYPLVNLHIYKPEGLGTAEEFAQKYGEELWATNDQLYDWVAKVEPAQRAYRELKVDAVLTGRRRSQGGKRGDIDIIETDEAGLIKINPLANWTLSQVQQYVQENSVPYNELLDRGYKSVGDWHSTQPVKEGEDERAGRWKGQEKTECGIHNPRSKFAQYLREQELKKHEEELRLALESRLEVSS